MYLVFRSDLGDRTSCTYFLLPRDSESSLDTVWPIDAWSSKSPAFQTCYFGSSEVSRCVSNLCASRALCVHQFKSLSAQLDVSESYIYLIKQYLSRPR
jgi:hypothetical protein